MSSHSPSPLPQPLTTTDLLSASVGLPVLDISWDHTTCGLLCLAPGAQLGFFQVYAHCSVCQCFIPSSG